MLRSNWILMLHSVTLQQNLQPLFLIPLMITYLKKEKPVLTTEYMPSLVSMDILEESAKSIPSMIIYHCLIPKYQVNNSADTIKLTLSISWLLQWFNTSVNKIGWFVWKMSTFSNFTVLNVYHCKYPNSVRTKK